MQRHLWIMGGETGPLLFAVQTQAGQPVGNRQSVEQVALGQQQVRAAVLHHVQQAFARVLDVQGHVGAAGLQHGEEGNHDFRTALHGDRHPHLGTDAAGDQRMCQAIGPAVQLGEAQHLVVEQHRRRVRGQACALRHPLVDQRRSGEARLAAVPQRIDQRALLGIQQAQLDQSPFGVVDEAFEQVQQVPVQLLDRGIGKRLAVIAVLQRQTVADAQGDGQRVVGLFMIAHRAEAHAAWRPLFQGFGHRVVLEYQQAVEQRLAEPGPTLDLEQRRVLLLAQRQAARLHLLQPVGEAHARLRRGDHRQGIDEQADLPFDPGQFGGTAGDGGAEDHRILPGVALQQ